MASCCSSAIFPITSAWAFSGVPPGKLDFIGPVDPERLLCCELAEGALAAANGRVRRVRAR